MRTQSATFGLTKVIGCFEGVFALGQVYVLVSRVVDPQNFVLVGVPPKDLLEDLAAALVARGVDVDKHFEDACSVTRGWIYDREALRLRDRIKVKFNTEHTLLLPCSYPAPTK